jgi:predicted nucleic acid-binding protein
LTRTFLDAGVLIAAIRGSPVPIERALEVINDPQRVFIAREFVRLEVLPKPLYFRQPHEADFYEAYFAAVAEMVEASRALVLQAYTEAQQVGLAGMDALHIAAAKAGGAEEFITTERPTTALFRVTGISVTTLRPP